MKSRWSEAAGKKTARKYYMITSEGKKALLEIESLWRDINHKAMMIMEEALNE